MMALGPARREPCTKCAMPVFIAERLLVGGRKLYHRTCFRCARCQHQLSLANCYETEEGQYCCEACPDEVDRKTSDSLTPSLVDNNDKSSADFEPVLEKVLTDHTDSVGDLKKNGQSTTAMSNFMIGQLEWVEQEVPPPLPPSVISEQASDIDVSICTSDMDRNCSHVNSASVSLDVSNSDINNSFDNVVNGRTLYFSTDINSSLAENADKVVEDVPLIESTIKCSDNVDEPITANTRQEDCDHDQNKLIIKCTKESGDTPPSSIVKMRMRMFDTELQEGNTPKLNFTARKSLVLSSKSRESIDTTASNLDDGVTTLLVSVPELNRSNEESKLSSSNKEVSTPTLVIESTVLVTSDTSKEDELKEVSTTVKKGNNIPNTVFKNDMEESSTAIEKKESLKDFNTEERCLEESSEVIAKNENLIISPVTSLDESIESTTIGDNIPNTNLNEISTNAVCFDDANKLDSAITTDLPVVPTEMPGADGHTVQSHDKHARRLSPVKNSIPVYPTEFNPFGDEESDEENKAVQSAASTNPFGCSDSEDDLSKTAKKATHAGKPPRPPQPVIRKSIGKVTREQKTSANPFWSDGEEPSSDEESTPKRVPVPRPRTVINVATPEPTPTARLRGSSGKYGSSNSLSSTDSSRNSTMRHKKKHAPPPPVPLSDPPLPDYAPPLPKTSPPVLEYSDTQSTTERPSPNCSTASSPKTLPRHRKGRPAPPPPEPELQHQLKKIVVSPAIECEKFEKDETNRNMQSKTLAPSEQTPFMIAANKSMYGQWKRKKGPAPPRPVPQRREIRAMPMKEVKRELDDIDVQQLGLERQGVSLEKMIRSKFEETLPTDGESPLAVTPDVEDLVLQLFEIVNEKNELFRRQAELMYLRRQHRLEEEHADLEYEIRCLLEHPEHTKTDTEKAYEEDLIKRLVDVVERRNEIVNCLEMDRQREVEEDRSIHQQLATFAAKGKDGENPTVPIEAGSTISLKKDTGTLKMLKKKVKKSKEKILKKKEATSIDADKDVDESDSTGKQTKDKKSKHKWF